MDNCEGSGYFYLPVSETNFDWGLYVTGTGTARIAPHTDYPPPGHPTVYDFDFRQGRTLPEFALVFIEEGSGEFTSRATGSVDIRDNALIVLFPDVWHSYRPHRETGWTEHWITLDGSYLYALMRRGVLSADKPILTPRSPSRLLHSFNRLLQMVHLHPSRNRPTYAARAMLILAEAIDSQVPEVATEVPTAFGHDTAQFAEEIVELAVSHIWNWSHRKITVTEIADTLGVHRRTLENYFRKVRDTTASEEIQRCRLERACRLLGSTRMPIKRIAMASGFSNAEHLSKAFRRHLGTTPTDYRRSAKADGR